MIMSQAEFARTHNVTRAAVNNAIKNGTSLCGFDISDAIVVDERGVSRIDTRLLRKKSEKMPEIRVNPSQFLQSMPQPSKIPFGLSEATLASLVPATISGVTAITSNVEIRADLKRPLMATLAGLAFAVVARIASSDENRAFYTLLGGLLGSTVYLIADHLQHRQRSQLTFKTSLDDVQKNNFVGEDMAIRGRNQSASTLAGNEPPEEKSSGGTLPKEAEESTFRIHPLPMKNASNSS
jgi:hypothetical protein